MFNLSKANYCSNDLVGTLVACAVVAGISLPLSSCNSNDGSSDSDAGSDSNSANGGSQSSWNPDYPGYFYGCEIPDSDEPALSECWNYVHPLPEAPATQTKSCEPGEIPHEDGCPSILNSSTGPVVATCQEVPDPTSNTGFADYDVYVVYEEMVLQSARDAASDPQATETEREACERLKTEFAGTECPENSIIVDVGLSSINCSRLND